MTYKRDPNIIPSPLPADYDRQFDFSDFQAGNPLTPLPGIPLDNEFNAIERSLDETQSRLELIQRDDGALRNQSVGLDQLKTEASIGVNAPEDWEAAKAYAVNESVIVDSGTWYIALQSHISTADFAADLAAGRWRLLIDLTPFTTEAKNWATQAEDDPVPEGNGTQFSAFHYSEKSETAKTAAQAARDVTTAARDVATAARDAAQLAQSESESARDTTVAARDTTVAARDVATDARDAAAVSASEAAASALSLDAAELISRNAPFTGAVIPRSDTTAVPLQATAQTTGKIASFRQGAGAGTERCAVNNDGGIVSQGDITALSDRRLKTNLTPISDALARVKALSGYTYTRADTGAEQTGLVAQELLAVLPQAVGGGPTEENPDAMYAVAYGNVVGLLVEAIKEQQVQIDDLKSRVSQREGY